MPIDNIMLKLGFVISNFCRFDKGPNVVIVHPLM